MRRVISGFLIMAGVLLLVYPLWMELETRLEQRRLANAQVVVHNSTSPMHSEQIPEALDFGCARLEIPAINLSVMVAPGTSPEQLKKSPGWYEDSALPGLGNTCIAAHRNTYGSWFCHLDRLKSGDDITLQWAGKTYCYTVSRVFLVDEGNTGVYAPSDHPALTLTTCQGSQMRLVVRALLNKTENIRSLS